MFKNAFYTLKADPQKGLCYKAKDTKEDISFSWPQFEICGKVSGTPTEFRETGRRRLTDSIIEITGEGNLICGAKLQIELRVSPYSPIIRFRYLLSAAAPLQRWLAND